ncbi:uncharacterized protein [Solanum lycopersicum]|uniref:uncharacterized protein n=1 Tax=Solanum lycopersicum TaxID=4081 RepID=UPI00374825F2
MTTQVNLSMVPRVNVVESNMTSRLRDFLRMNTPLFLVSMVGEDPKELLHGVYKVLRAMGVTPNEKEDLHSYQLIEVALVWYTQWNNNRPVESGPIEWEEFKESFLGKYIPRERREVKVEEFINLKQGNIRVEEYSFKFSMLSRYAQYLVSN